MARFFCCCVRIFIYSFVCELHRFLSLLFPCASEAIYFRFLLFECQQHILDFLIFHSDSHCNCAQSRAKAKTNSSECVQTDFRSLYAISALSQACTTYSQCCFVSIILFKQPNSNISAERSPYTQRQPQDFFSRNNWSNWKWTIRWSVSRSKYNGALLYSTLKNKLFVFNAWLDKIAFDEISMERNHCDDNLMRSTFNLIGLKMEFIHDLQGYLPKLIYEMSSPGWCSQILLAIAKYQSYFESTLSSILMGNVCSCYLQ